MSEQEPATPEEDRARRFEILARMREPFKDISPEEIEQEVAKAINEVRQEQRALRNLKATQHEPNE